jgi:hypothetical protein
LIFLFIYVLEEDEIDDLFNEFQKPKTETKKETKGKKEKKTGLFEQRFVLKH